MFPSLAYTLPSARRMRSGVAGCCWILAAPSGRRASLIAFMTAAGAPAVTTWRTTGEVEAEVSFGRDGVWNGFSTKGDDGSNVTYERA